METFLTCRAVAAHLTQEKLLSESDGKFFEELSLKAVLKTLSTRFTFADARLLISELPKILTLKYSVVDEIRAICIKIIPQMMDSLRLSITSISRFGLWRDIQELESTLKLLEVFDAYSHK